MPRMKGCWVVEDYTYRLCPEPAKEFAFAVSLHNHSCHSVEKLSSINEVIKLRFMRPFRKTLQAAFGLAAVSELDYSEIYYQPPLTAEEVFLVEASNVAELGFGGLFGWALPIMTKLKAAFRIAAEASVRSASQSARRRAFFPLSGLSLSSWNYRIARGRDCRDSYQPAGGNAREPGGRSVRDIACERMSDGVEPSSGSVGERSGAQDSGARTSRPLWLGDSCIGIQRYAHPG